MPQCAHNQDASNATFGWRIWCHLAKLHVCEVRKAFEYLEVIRYNKTHWHLDSTLWVCPVLYQHWAKPLPEAGLCCLIVCFGWYQLAPIDSNKFESHLNCKPQLTSTNKINPAFDSFQSDPEHIRIQGIAVGGRHFWLFGLLRAPEYMLYTHLTYHACTLCIHTTICIFSGPLSIINGHAPTTVIQGTEYIQRNMYSKEQWVFSVYRT